MDPKIIQPTSVVTTYTINSTQRGHGAPWEISAAAMRIHLHDRWIRTLLGKRGELSRNLWSSGSRIGYLKTDIDFPLKIFHWSFSPFSFPVESVTPSFQSSSAADLERNFVLNSRGGCGLVYFLATSVAKRNSTKMDPQSDPFFFLFFGGVFSLMIQQKSSWFPERNWARLVSEKMSLTGSHLNHQQ